MIMRVIPAENPGQFQVAVVMGTVLRPSLLRAVQSVFDQRLEGSGQLLIGIDLALGERQLLDEIASRRPERWSLAILDPGYSTSERHGGLHPARDGGALRTVLSYLAHSRYVAYLDDDNWWAPTHLASLLAAVAGGQWAFSKRWFADPESLQPLAVDEWESVGPDRGVYRARFGGFVDPNTLLIDKVACEPVLRWWSMPLPGDPKGMSADRQVFDRLRRQYRGVATGQATCYYRLDPRDDVHHNRLTLIARARGGAAGSQPQSRHDEVLP